MSPQTRRRLNEWPAIIREHRMTAAHMADVASGRVQPRDEEDESPKPVRTYSVVRDGRQGGWFDPGYGVRDDLTGVLVNEIPIEDEAKANRFAEELEEAEEVRL